MAQGKGLTGIGRRNDMSKESYYRENLPELINRLKNSIKKVAPIIDQDIDEDIKDDKLFNVLKAKRQAAEDVVWTMKEIDRLERELSGEPEEEKQEVETGPVHPSKRFSRSA